MAIAFIKDPEICAERVRELVGRAENALSGARGSMPTELYGAFADLQRDSMSGERLKAIRYRVEFITHHPY